MVGGGWGQSLPEDGPSLYGSSRPEAEESSPEVGSLAPWEVDGVIPPRDGSDVSAGENSTETFHAPARPCASGPGIGHAATGRSSTCLPTWYESRRICVARPRPRTADFQG